MKVSSSEERQRYAPFLQKYFMVYRLNRIIDPLTLFDLRTLQTADTTGRRETRRHSNVTDKPPGMTTSHHVTWKLTEKRLNGTAKIHASFSTQKTAWRALRNVFPIRTMDTLYGIISMNRSERQVPRVTLGDLEVNDVI